MDRGKTLFWGFGGNDVMKFRFADLLIKKTLTYLSSERNIVTQVLLQGQLAQHRFHGGFDLMSLIHHCVMTGKSSSSYFIQSMDDPCGKKLLKTSATNLGVLNLL